jgi:hypothetical protein
MLLCSEDTYIRACVAVSVRLSGNETLALHKDQEDVQQINQRSRSRYTGRFTVLIKRGTGASTLRTRYGSTRDRGTCSIAKFAMHSCVARPRCIAVLLGYNVRCSDDDPDRWSCSV